MAEASAFSALPGNPYAPEATKAYGLSEPQALRYAILAVAHELRTANLQRAADTIAAPIDLTDLSPEEYDLWEGIQKEVGTRLGVQR